MQSLKEEIKDYHDILETGFSDFEDENEQFSDIENKFQSQHLIQHLQSTNNSTSNQIAMASQFQKIHSDVATFKWKETRLAKLCTSKKSRDPVLQKKRKPINNLSLNKVTTGIQKYLDEHSDSEDFYTPIKKRKKIEKQSDFTQASVPINLVNDETNNVSIEEMSKSQSDMSVSSTQRSLMSQGTVSSQNEMKILDSQESSVSRKQLSQNSSLSPERIASSQESLGDKIMSISIEESAISNTTNQSKIPNCILPHINSECQQISDHKIVETLNVHQNACCPKPNIDNQQTLINNTLQSKNVKINIENNYSDIYSMKNNGRYGKTRSRYMWNIRKRELEVTKRENAVAIREKWLEAREAEIQKREAILNLRNRKYLRYKSSKLNVKCMKKEQKQKIKSKKLKKAGVLEDETNIQLP